MTDLLASIGLISDIHTGHAGAWAAGELDALRNQMNGLPVARWVLAGDLLDSGTSGEYATYESSFGGAMALTAPYHEMNGNHDDPLDPFPLTFAWDVGPFRFIGFYMNVLEGSYMGSMTTDMVAAVGTALSAAAAVGKRPILVSHYPIYCPQKDHLAAGSGQEGMLALCQAHNVPIALSGHNHPLDPYVDPYQRTTHYSGLAARGTYDAPEYSSRAYQIIDVFSDHFDVYAYDALSPFAALWAEPLRLEVPMAVFGDQNVESALGTPGANTKNVSKFTLAEDALVSKLTMYCANTGASQVAGKVKGIIYSDAAGAPDALMGASEEVPVAQAQAAAWVDFAFAAPVLLGPGDYWLGNITDVAGFGIYRGSSGGHREWYADTYSDGASDPWGAHANAGTFPYSVYATYTTPPPPADPSSRWFRRRGRDAQHKYVFYRMKG